jgi:chemotaxis protein histidine kinase CheA
MADKDVSFDHDEFDALLDQARYLAEDGMSNEDIIDETGLDPSTVEMLRGEDAEDSDYRESTLDTLDTGEKMNHDIRDSGEKSAERIDGLSADVDDRPGASPGSSPATQLSAAKDDAVSQAQQQIAAQQAQAQAAQQQQQAAQQAQQVAQFNAQQQAAWNQAMQQQQAQQQMAQMNMGAQQQVVQQTAQMNQASDAEIRAAIQELFDDDSTHVGGSTSSSGDMTTGTEVDTDNLGGAENVSFEKTYPDGAMSEGDVAAAIDQAADAAGVSDDPEVRSKFTNLYMGMAEHESGLNPGAANGWDSNAVGAEQSDGFPAQSSRGLVQCIPETFSTYHASGTSNSIYDPVASVAASMNYIADRYGVDLKTGAGLEEFGSSRGIDVSSGAKTGGYVGY